MVGTELFRLLGTIAIDTSGVDDAVKTVKSKCESLGDTLSNAGKSISNVGTKLTLGVTTPLTLLGKSAISTASDFEDGMLKVQSLTGATGEEYDKLTEAAKYYGSTTAWTASNVTEAMQYMALAGFDAGQILESLGGMLSLASASGEDLGTVTDILTDSMTAFGDSASDAERYADVLATTQAKSNTTVGLLGEAFKYAAPLAGSYGYKLEDVATALGLMANAGVKGSMAGTALSSIITRLGVNTDGCRDNLEELGVSFFNSDGTARDLSLVLKDMCNVMGDLSTEDQAWYAKKIAGQEAMKGLLAIVNQGSDAFTDLENKIKSSDGTASDMATNMESGLGGSIRSLKSALEGVVITLGDSLAPILTLVADNIKKFCSWFQSLDKTTQDNIVKFGLLVAAAGPVLTVIGKMFTAVGSIIKIGGSLVKGVGSVIKIGGTLGNAIGGIIKLGGGIVSGITKVLIPAITGISAPVLVVIGVIAALVTIGVVLYKNWDTIKEYAAKAWEAITSTVKKGVEAVGKFFGNCIDGIKDFAKNTSEKLKSIKDNTVEAFSNMKEKAAEKLSEMKQHFSEGFQNMKDNAVEKVTEMKEKISDGFQKLKDEASSKFTDLKEKWGSKFDEAKEKITDSCTKIKENVVTRFEDLRTNAIEKLSEVANKGVDGFNTIKEKGSAAINSLKDHASSKFSEMGGIIFEKFSGYADKISSTFSGVKDAVGNIVEKVKEFFKFDWKLPAIKLPHFKVEWETDGVIAKAMQAIGLQGLPKLAVDWYAKAMDNPMIMDSPTAFGVNASGQIMAGGEKGSEVVSGTNTLMQMISEAVSANNNAIYGTLDNILSIISQYMPEMAQKQILLNTGELVGALASPMNEELGRITYMRGRRN